MSPGRKPRPKEICRRAAGRFRVYASPKMSRLNEVPSPGHSEDRGFERRGSQGRIYSKEEKSMGGASLKAPNLLYNFL